MSIERATISDREWSMIVPILPSLPKVKIGDLNKCRRFIGAVLWVLRGGAEWRMLPPEQGKDSGRLALNVVLKFFKTCLLFRTLFGVA